MDACGRKLHRVKALERANYCLERLIIGRTGTGGIPRFTRSLAPVHAKLIKLLPAADRDNWPMTLA